MWSEIRVISKKKDPNPRIRIRNTHIWIRIRGSEIRKIIFWIRIRDPDPKYSRIIDPSFGSCDSSDLTDLGSWPRILWSVGSYRIWIRWIRGYLFDCLFIAIQFNGIGCTNYNFQIFSSLSGLKRVKSKNKTHFYLHNYTPGRVGNRISKHQQFKKLTERHSKIRPTPGVLRIPFGNNLVARRWHPSKGQQQL